MKCGIKKEKGRTLKFKIRVISYSFDAKLFKGSVVTDIKMIPYNRACNRHGVIYLILCVHMQHVIIIK